MLSLIASLLRLASLVICLIVLAWFVVFAVDQTSNASTHQQNELGGASVTPPPRAKPESSLHRRLDEVSDELTSPFSGVVSSSHSQWEIHIVRTALALLVYGLGLAFVARFLRIRT